ncbi:cysteine/serine-rich nuclear protein 3 isoform X2 [Austrofundulus limnaeus]|uniref:Cysteine/serine-rich nuclear protein 3 isoform X2 n=1 Tax=Austrofundulus limnaeus TaxID=52670 RepID=A0A2I4CZN9_AUSLI|nr:PREDICTED: cysteine/serine-rich nuclear protein 3-like isoform X2 [Austrofundulus limnaeus]
MQGSESRGPPGNQRRAEETGVTSGQSLMMSGILKRKLEEGPSYLSLQGSDDDEVSCSDSGNSSDSLNHSVPSGILDSSTQQPSKRLRSRNVHFESVTVYYFSRRQGFTTVPTQGGSTLGMSPRHSGVRRFTLREFAMEQKRSHRNMLRDHLKEEKLNAIKLKLTKNGTASSIEADGLTLDDISEDDLDVDNTEVDDYFFLQPLTTRRRRALLRASGVRRIDVEEKHELRALRMSREECGCRCRGTCDPETCACSLAGIKCQVDRMSFPCGCTKEGCSNSTGRLEFNPVRVRTHFLHTIMKLELERSHDEQYQHRQTEPQLVTNGNGYHGDPAFIPQQQQPNPQSVPLHEPIMQLQSTGDTELHLEEEEEEDEEEDEEEEDDDDDEDDDDEEEDEAYDEDGSSVCSGLSDCSTHSLETLDPEEGEDDDDDEEDDEEEEEEEEEEDWDCSVHGLSPPPYPVPLPSVLSYSNSTLVSLSSPFHNTSPMQPYHTESSAHDLPAFLGESLNPAPILPSVESALESDMGRELKRQAEQQGAPLRFSESPTLHTCEFATSLTSVEQPRPLQNNPDRCDAQTGGTGAPAEEQPGLQKDGGADQTTSENV